MMNLLTTRQTAAAVGLCLAMLWSSASAHDQWGQYPENDQRRGRCEFSDWSRFAFVQSVYDGDTITVDIDMGFKLMWLDQDIRFYGVNASEIRNKDLVDKAAGLEARDWLREQIDQRWIVITTYKDKSGKFGRKLATVCRDGRRIIVQMLRTGRLRQAEY